MPVKFANYLKSRPIFSMFYCFWIFVNKLFIYLTGLYLKSKRCFNVKSSTNYFHMKTKILVDFQIWISVPLKKKAYRNSRLTFLKNCFRHLKLYSNPPSWLARGRCHMGTFWKTEDWSSYFWEGQPFRFWYVEFHHQRRLNSTKTGIYSWF